MRIKYRATQFWKALSTGPSLEQITKARNILTPQLMGLFLTMQPSEQAHSLKILEELEQQGHVQPDLLTAALLHDVGKTRYPLRIWERVEIVIAKFCFPKKVEAWGRGDALGWKRPFVVAVQHPAWGADAAAAAGASPLSVDLIRRHQTRLPADLYGNQSSALEEQYLQYLQLVDEKY